MKKFLLLSVAATLISSLSFAKVWRVNNLPGVNTNFISAADAIASASVHDGDTLHIESSPTVYADITINKQLTLIGPGYLLNVDPAVQFNLNSAVFSTITVVVPNVNIYGLKISSLNLYGTEALGLTTAANNAFISRNYCAAISTNGTLYNISINQNVIAGSFSITNYPVSSLLFNNNIVGGTFSNAGGSSSNGVIENNIFHTNSQADYWNTLAFGEGTYSINGNINLAGNYWANPSVVSGTTNTVMGYNMAEANAIFPAGSGNQNNVDMSGAKVFLDGTQQLSDIASDTLWQLSASSPAKTAGAGGTPIGAFGGGAPYKLSGIPPVPSIYKMSISTAIATGSTVPVTFSSKSNN